jgi:uncharacterized membrane protein YhhN
MMPFYYIKYFDPFMLKRHSAFFLVFLIIAIFQLSSIFYNNQNLHTYSLALVSISLGIYLIKTTSLKGRFHKRMLTGLVFFLIADLILQLNPSDKNYFIYGLASYGLGHIFYTRAFYLDFKSAPELDKRGARWAILVIAFVSILFFYYLRPHLGAMRVLVLGYILIISFMGMMSAFRHLRVNNLSFMLIVIGAGLFLLSDAIFAYNYFVAPSKVAVTMSVATYLSAQFLITIGAIERQLINKDSY